MAGTARTSPWVNVDYWASFASYYSGRVYLLGNVWNMGLGDVLQIDGEPDGVKHHTMMVSYLSGGTPYFTYHTNNRYRRSLNQVLSDWAPPTTTLGGRDSIDDRNGGEDPCTGSPRHRCQRLQ